MTTEAGSVENSHHPSSEGASPLFAAITPNSNLWIQAEQVDLEFDGELLIPKANMAAYKQIYALEGWLRRICLTLWMGEFGNAWIDKLNPNLRRTLESRVRRNQQRLYLGAESHDDLIWQATHSELLSLLTADDVAPSMQPLIGIDSDFLKRKLDEVREIRNLLAHNRALSSRTHVILSGLLASLVEAVDAFKLHILYGSTDILDHNHWIGARLDLLMERNDWSKFQALVARKGKFIEYVSLPVAPYDKWPDARLLLEAFREHLDGIVAFCLNKSGNEFIVLTPERLAAKSQESLCDAFARNPRVWSKVPFAAQEPRFICSPKIWFYENRSPLDVLPLGI
ncbi:hypothetical protein [Nonomuraea sp. B1E8]|uniref:hypothetical protein n=1 Tax=unclassified Nonomuraea TaxID=2593643 RepID=UPI00325E3046